MHIEFPRIANRVPFIALRKGEFELGLGAHAITFAWRPDGVSVFWM